MWLSEVQAFPVRKFPSSFESRCFPYFLQVHHSPVRRMLFLTAVYSRIYIIIILEKNKKAIDKFD